MTHTLRTLVALALVTVVAGANAELIGDWNLVVRHDLVTTSEVDGSALIGGSLSGTSNYAVHGVTAPNGDGLAVGGNIIGNSSIQINNGGNLRIGGSVQAGSQVTLNGGGVQISDAGVSWTVDTVFAQAEAISSSLSGLAANGTLDGAGNMTATPTFMDGYNVAVYNLTNDQFQGLGQLNLNMGTADSVIINVLSSGGVVDLGAPPNLIGGFNQGNSSRILWNLSDATDVLVNNSFNGAMLAPYANLELLGGGMNGSVIVDSFSRMWAEVRDYTYEGYVPEPMSALLVGIGGMLMLRRRRAA